MDFGPFFNGTWKISSVVFSEDFQTHDGVDGATRYRLVFTPAAGFTLPADNVLPEGFFNVGTSAVYLAYVAGDLAS